MSKLYHNHKRPVSISETNEYDTFFMSLDPQNLRRSCPKSFWTGGTKTCQWCNVSLLGGSTKRRRTWCSEECFNKFQTHHVWSHAKKEALRLRNMRCAAKNCLQPTHDLKVVHKKPLGEERYGLSCHHHQENLIVLCREHRKLYKNKIYV